MGIILPVVGKGVNISAKIGGGGHPPAPGSYGPAFIAFIEPGNMFHPSGTEWESKDNNCIAYNYSTCKHTCLR